MYNIYISTHVFINVIINGYFRISILKYVNNIKEIVGNTVFFFANVFITYFNYLECY